MDPERGNRQVGRVGAPHRGHAGPRQDHGSEGLQGRGLHGRTRHPELRHRGPRRQRVGRHLGESFRSLRVRVRRPADQEPDPGSPRQGVRQGRQAPQGYRRRQVRIRHEHHRLLPGEQQGLRSGVLEAHLGDQRRQRGTAKDYHQPPHRRSPDRWHLVQGRIHLLGARIPEQQRLRRPGQSWLDGRNRPVLGEAWRSGAA